MALGFVFGGLICMLPVLVGIILRTGEKLIIGWFGARGLASVVFGVIVLNPHLPGGGFIAMKAVRTLLLSTILHGLCANPLVAALGASVIQRH